MSTIKGTVTDILDKALKRLKTQNRRVSVRSLAIQLELSPSYLNKIFRGEKPLSLNLVPELSRLLQLDHHEVSELQRLLLSSIEERKLKQPTGLSGVERTEPSKLVTDYQSMSKDDLWMLEDWYHLPLWNLVATEDFAPSIESIASRLGIKVAQAKRSIEKLIESGHLKHGEDGEIKQTHQQIRFPTQRSHPSVRSYHGDMIQKAEVELKTNIAEKDFSLRLISGLSFTANPNKMAEAKIILEEAAYRAAELLSDNNCTEVYQLNLQLFPLTKNFE